MHLHTLTSSRLRLRSWTETDRPTFAALNSDPEVMRFFPSTLTRPESDAVFDRLISHFASHGFGFWSVDLLERSEFIGFVGISRCEPPLPFAPAVEIGWRLAKAYHGNGYATEAARACLEFGFGTLELNEIVAYTTEGNAPSRNVMRKLGMAHDAVDDFDHPRLGEGHALRRHVVYRIRADELTAPGIRARHEGCNMDS